MAIFGLSERAASYPDAIGEKISGQFVGERLRAANIQNFLCAGIAQFRPPPQEAPGTAVRTRCFLACSHGRSAHDGVECGLQQASGRKHDPERPLSRNDAVDVFFGGGRWHGRLRPDH